MLLFKQRPRISTRLFCPTIGILYDLLAAACSLELMRFTLFRHSRWSGRHCLNSMLASQHFLLPTLTVLRSLLQMDALLEREDGRAAQHPILDNIRRCSSTPDEAVDFFTLILNPEPQLRPTAAEAQEHPYIRRCAGHMRHYLQSQVAADKPSVQESHAQPAPGQRERVRPAKRRLVHCMAGAVKQQSGLLAKTVGRVLNPLSSLTGRCSSASRSDIASKSGDSSKPPLSAYFLDYKHQAEPCSHEEALNFACAANSRSVKSGGAQAAPPSPEQHHFQTRLSSSDQDGGPAASTQQPAGTAQQAQSSAVGKSVTGASARQPLMPLGLVPHTARPGQTAPVQKEQADSTLPATPAFSMSQQPGMSPAQADGENNESTPDDILEQSAGRYMFADVLLVLNTCWTQAVSDDVRLHQLCAAWQATGIFCSHSVLM